MAHADAIAFAESELVAGDNLTRKEFLRRWRASPKIRFAELIRGIVYMPSPVSLDHGGPDCHVTTWLGTYEAATPGTSACVNTTWFMTGEETPQPDVALRILPDYGGQSRLAGRYPAGAPEFLSETCVSSKSIDLHQKLEVYEESGVQEYMALLTKERQVRWHRRRRGKLVLLPAPSHGIYRSSVFPGLWLDSRALLSRDLPRVLAVLHQGMDSPEHAAFVAKLAAQRKSN